MELYSFLLYTISLLFVFISLYKVSCIKFLERNVERNVHLKIKKRETRIVLIIPVFHEEKIIKETVKFFNKITDVDVYYVTTDKEKDKESGNNETLNNLLHLVKKKYIINYPQRTGNKADQLNFAIKYLLDTYHGEHVYFGIFDADSRPDINVFKYICQDKKSEIIYQMLSVYNTNFLQTSNICKSNAILQTRWSFWFEYKKLSENYESGNMQNLMYLIGHGIFIRGDFIKNNLFPIDSITEDIAYGYKACLKGVFAKPIPYFYDYCSVPNSLKDNIKQISRWFYGEFELVIKFIFHSSDYKKFYYKRLFELILRGYGGIIISITLIVSFFTYNITSLFLIFLGLGIEYISFVSTYKKIINDNKLSTRIYIYSIIKNILDFIPLSMSIYNMLYNYFTHKEETFLKTKR